MTTFITNRVHCAACNAEYTSVNVRCIFCSRSWDQTVLDTFTVEIETPAAIEQNTVETVVTVDVPEYSPMVRGVNAITQMVVCKDGVNRLVRTEQYADGFHAFIVAQDGDYTNHTGYKTSRKAINALARMYA